jgi:hypothetical protein
MAKFNAQSTTYTYIFLHEGSYYSLQEAIALEEGSFFRYMSSMLFSTFCLEGYLYFLGERYIPSWSRKERKMGQDGRLQALLQALEMQPDMSERPFNTYKEMFDFRNALVHSRVIKTTATGTLESMTQRPPKPLSEWEKLLNRETAKRFFDDSTQIIRMMHMKAGFAEDPFATPWVSQWEINPE